MHRTILLFLYTETSYLKAIQGITQQIAQLPSHYLKIGKFSQSPLYKALKKIFQDYKKSLQIEDRNNRKYVEAYIESQNVDMVDDEELLTRVRQVLDELPEKCREVCLLRFVEGYKYAEIAARLDMNENTVKAQLHRGMERLKQAFATYDYVLVLCALGRIFMDR